MLSSPGEELLQYFDNACLIILGLIGDMSNLDSK